MKNQDLRSKSVFYPSRSEAARRKQVKREPPGACFFSEYGEYADIFLDINAVKRYTGVRGRVALVFSAPALL